MRPRSRTPAKCARPAPTTTPPSCWPARSLALRRSRGGREAGDAQAQRALSVNLERLADLREDRGHRMRALDLYRESYDIAGRLAAADPARFGPDLAATRARLNELEAKIQR